MENRDRFNLRGHTIAGTFRVDEVVAEGGFGIVYKAYHLHFRSPVALKCLKIPGELSQNERNEFLEQFRSEAEIQFRLSAELPHVVRPLHVDAIHTSAGEFVPMMALEWLDGQSFEHIIDQRCVSGEAPMTLTEAMDLIGPAALSLHRAHHFEAAPGEAMTVVHRDIKPDNLFLTELGGKKVVKILDFGISKVRRAATQLAGHFSQTGGSAPFSPAYGAPEQWVPKRFGQTGPWTDVWGLALTLVEIIKGDAVIVGDHQAMMGTALDPKVRPTPRAEGVIVTDDVEAVFAKALALDPRYRYQTIEAFWESLHAAVEHAGDLTQGYDETPSGSRIALPRMSAPTPWTHPYPVLDKPKDAIPGLPPMLAPARAEPTLAKDLPHPEGFETNVSLPMNPGTGLQPVLAAPTSFADFDPHIPPIGDGAAPLHREEPEAPPVPELEIVRDLTADPSLFVAPAPHLQRGDPSIKLELQNTSSFPQPPPLNTGSQKGRPPPPRPSPPHQSRAGSPPAPPPPRRNQAPPPPRRSAQAPPGSERDLNEEEEAESKKPLSLLPVAGKKARS